MQDTAGEKPFFSRSRGTPPRLFVFFYRVTGGIESRRCMSEYSGSLIYNPQPDCSSLVSHLAQH